MRVCAECGLQETELIEKEGESPDPTPTPTPTPTPDPQPVPVPVVSSVTINSTTVSAGTLKDALGEVEGVTTTVLGKKTKKISKGAFRNCKSVKTLVIKSTKLKKATVRNSLKGSSITKVKVNVGKKKINTKYVKKYKTIFTKKNAGKKVRVTL
jgi:hypothetical protein